MCLIFVLTSIFVLSCSKCLSTIDCEIHGVIFFFFFFKQKTAYEMRISDWSSDVCSSDLTRADLASLIGQSRATEVLARKRGLTLHMIRKIERAWHVPASILVREYQLSR